MNDGPEGARSDPYDDAEVMCLMNGGSGKGGMTQAATEALGKLLHHDNDDATNSRPGPRQRMFAVVLIVVVLAGWGLWELIV